jgi:hypothetical protein
VMMIMIMILMFLTICNQTNSTTCDWLEWLCVFLCLRQSDRVGLFVSKHDRVTACDCDSMNMSKTLHCRVFEIAVILWWWFLRWLDHLRTNECHQVLPTNVNVCFFCMTWCQNGPSWIKLYQIWLSWTKWD